MLEIREQYGCGAQEVTTASDIATRKSGTFSSGTGGHGLAIS